MEGVSGRVPPHKGAACGRPPRKGKERLERGETFARLFPGRELTLAESSLFRFWVVSKPLYQDKIKCVFAHGF